MALVEQRQFHPRLPANMSARIVAPGQISPAPCVVREISQFGAKLEIRPGWIIPRTFWLRIDGDSRLHHCLVVWRSSLIIGVDFPKEHDNTWWRHSRELLKKQIPSRARI